MIKKIKDFIEKNKTKTTTLLFAVGIVCLLIGISYAFFNVNFLGERENQLVIGENLIFRYDEKGDALSLTNDDIISDAEGKKNSKYFDFEVSQQTETRTKTNYSIYLTKDSTSTLSDSNVKIYLTDQDNNVLKGITTIGSLTPHETYENSFILYNKSITTVNNQTQTDKYRLRVWIDEGVSTTITEQDGVHSLETVDNTYKFTINVEAVGESLEDADDKKANAYALLLDNSEDENNPVPMIFVRENSAIAVGDTYESETYGPLEVTAVYSDFEDKNYYFNDFEDLYVPQWLENSSSITSVIFEDKIAPISTAIWFNLTNCSDINLQKLDTSNVINMSYMFESAVLLTNLDLSNFNTTNVTNMSFMFDNCDSLTTLNISSFNTQNVTNMSFMFNECSLLTMLDLSNFNTQNVTNMNGMFNFCSSLTTLNLSSFNTTKVTDMNGMFSGCSSLTTLNLSNFNTQNVTNMNFMFSSCSSLTTLNLSSFNTQNVTDMMRMFYSCSSLTMLNLSNFNTQNVTDMNEMFSGCSSLTTLDLSNFNTQNVTDMGSMFSDCSSLILNCSNWDVKNVVRSLMFNYNAPGVTAPTWPTTCTNC